ncbi:MULTISPECIES: thiopeptide-type bacteriocin biosynthesis protein [unclassified Mesorhizobium]|uniref:thiopeptide-type bacteriocin biosynthesis protein n=1 Tax=unclassified Mesorhizobium TaxID=325217 RepID=UPI0018DC5250|nr:MULTISPECIES: thiopeptide-type bacteriocin biosynthesis protein [unclassified Mesorhizobium]WJI81252.1 thiopeptide-type bacteriocin biosynthesis protein [Mesorhizobium sp. C374B]WJI87771.1 thiopeptide-type bacteriocin biosynthesis protein [Mesorhizobium sp. C372A]
MHVFYNVDDLRTIINECIRPTVEELLNSGLVSRFFFIRYWEGGTHIRLRLLPSSDAMRDAVMHQAAGRVRLYLDKYPSLFEPDPKVMIPAMRRLFVTEYGTASYSMRYGEADIPLRPNNAISFETYEPEVARYGGKYGVSLAEQHFHISSLTALKILMVPNNRRRSSLLGNSFLLMLHFALAFYGDLGRTASFFSGYRSTFRELELDASAEVVYMDHFHRQRSLFPTSVVELLEMNSYLRSDTSSSLSGLIGHADWLREQVKDLIDRGHLSFGSELLSPDAMANHMLGHFLHMWNNRIGVRISEELYIAHMIRILILQLLGVPAPLSNSSVVG